MLTAEQKNARLLELSARLYNTWQTNPDAINKSKNRDQILSIVKSYRNYLREQEVARFEEIQRKVQADRQTVAAFDPANIYRNKIPQPATLNPQLVTPNPPARLLRESGKGGELVTSQAQPPNEILDSAQDELLKMADGYASAKPDVTIAPGAEAPERGIHTEIVRSKPQTFFNAPLITESALNKLPVKDRIRMDIGRPYPKQYQLGEPRTVLDVALVEPVATMAQTIFSKAANLNDALYQLSDALNKDFGLPKAETLKELSLLAENAAKDAEKLGIPANESIVSKITSELYKGLGGVAFDLPIINAIGLPAYMGAMGGAESYREHGAFLPGVATGLIKGKAFSSALHGTASLPKYIGGASTGALFGSMSLLDETSKPDKDIDWSNVISQTIIGTLLAYNPNRQSLFAWMKRNLGDTPAVANLDDRNLSYLREIFKSGK
ncbi:MAG: hypothetical protein PHC43_00920, partial [Candidatus Marinimicrobia bacterium]|nr:hypothetical protein [Candidatus Neomarinimicrobiota bacterium]MDD5229870.1 hypothetical protein [Candidatus Neomarinimicrobiota bacterium]